MKIQIIMDFANSHLELTEGYAVIFISIMAFLELALSVLVYLLIQFFKK